MFFANIGIHNGIKVSDKFMSGKQADDVKFARTTAMVRLLDVIQGILAN